MTDSSGILILGGAGFIGSNFTRTATDLFDSVYVVDKLTYAGERANLADVESEIEFIKADIRNREPLTDVYAAADYVVNFAAESFVDKSIESGQEFIQSNVEGSFVAMDLLREHDVEKFVQISTDEVYGSTMSEPFTEDHPLDPSSPYSASKASSDLLVNALWETYDLPITVLRPTNVYGPRQHPEKLIPKFTLRALRGDELPLYGDGSNVRQWLYVDDFCRGLYSVICEGNNEIYNLGGTDEKTNLEVTEAILEETGASKDLITLVEDRKGHDQRYAVDDSRLRKVTGFQPKIGFEKGLSSTIDWYKRNKERYI